MASIRFLGHASWELTDGGTTVLVDPWLTGNPKAAAAPTSSSADAILLTHGHAGPLRRHDRRSPSAPARPSSRSSSSPARSPATSATTTPSTTRTSAGRSTSTGAGSRSSPRGTRGTSPERHRRTRPPGSSSTSAARPIYYLGRHRALQRSRAPGQAVADRRRDHPDRRALHDGPLRRRRGGEAHRSQAGDPRHYNTFPPVATDEQAFKTDVESATDSPGRRSSSRGRRTRT